jgi:hypothetical protein
MALIAVVFAVTLAAFTMIGKPLHAVTPGNAHGEFQHHNKCRPFRVTMEKCGNQTLSSSSHFREF